MQKTFVQTFFSRALILVLNFGIIILSTNIWGSEGKGTISIVIADLAIIGFISNIFVGSSITYFASKYRTEQILVYAYLWSVIVGISIPVIFSQTVHEVYNIYYLIGLSVLFSLLTANINLFVGQQNIRKFNLFSILQQAVHIAFLLIAVYLFDFKSVDAYFISLLCCYLILYLISSLQLLRVCSFSDVSFSKKVCNSMFSYGWKTQLSAFMQFLNYRLSFYFLEFFRGIGSVGIFSIGVAVSEAIWAVSRSLSMILYSKVVNSSDHKESIEHAKTAIKLSFLITLLFIVIILFIPAKVYPFVFGQEFSQTKQIFIMLSPGILAIAVSNIMGFYFAGINKLRILNVKSLVGLLFTVVSSFFIIPRWGVVGACMVTTVSYSLSSAVLFWKFYQDTEFNIRDFFLSRADINMVTQKIAKRNFYK